MGTRLIELKDGLRVEVEAGDEGMEQVASGMEERLEGALEDAQALLMKAVSPVVAVWKEMNREVNVSQAEVELALGFSAEGNLFLAKGSGSANIKFKLTVKPPEPK